jgi:ankyrin repeat protein
MVFLLLLCGLTQGCGKPVDDVDVNAKDGIGWTALHWVVRNGYRVDFKNENIDVIRYLIENGADVNAKNDDGETPLDDAYIYGTDEIRQILRDAGGKSGKEI